jgi:hypothetical protein
MRRFSSLADKGHTDSLFGGERNLGKPACSVHKALIINIL